MGRADSGVSRCPHRLQRRRRQLGRRGAPARLPHVQLRLEQGQGVGSDPKSQDLQLLGMSRQHSTGGPCSRGELLISAGGTTVLQDFTLLLSQCEIQALATSHSPGKQPHSLAFLEDGVAVYWGMLTCCCFLGAGMFSGVLGRSMSMHGCSPCRCFHPLLPLDAFSMHFSSSQIWEGLTQRFHRVIALDFLGFGFSDKPVSTLA